MFYAVTAMFLAEHLFIAVCNFASSIFILRTKDLRRTFHYIVFALLFLSHLCYSVSYIIYACLVLTPKKHPTIIDLFQKTAEVFYGLTSSFTFLLNLDKFLAIRFPFKYENFGKCERMSMIGLSCFSNIVFHTWSLYSKAAFIFAFVSIIIGILIITIVNLYLYRVVKCQCK